MIPLTYIPHRASQHDHVNPSDFTKPLIPPHLDRQEQMLTHICLATGYFSRQDTRTPVRLGIIAMVANMVFNLLLIWHLRHAGLALATAASAWVNTFLLYRGLAHEGVYRPGAGWGLFMARLALATAVMGVVTGWWAHQTPLWYSAPALERAGALALLVLAGAGCYTLMLLLLGMRPRHLRRA